MHLSVIVPAFNESGRIAKPLIDTYRILTENTIEHEIIVVDDGSTDKTIDTLHSLKKAIPSLVVLSLDKNTGKGAALRYGVNKSTGSYVLTVDADGSTPFNEYFKFYKTITQKPYDIVIGGRHSPTSKILVKQPWYRIFISRSANAIIQKTLLPGIQDTQCGFKLYSGKIARDLFGKSHTNGFGIDMEILMLAKIYGHATKELPVTWLNSPESRVRPVRSTLKTLRELCIILLRYKYSSGK